MAHPFHLLLLLLPTYHLFLLPFAASIGVNYGTVADNLPPPSTVATFLKSQTTIDRVKIFDTNPVMLRAFAGTNIAVTVTVGNGDIPKLAKLPAAQSWVANNILPYHPKTTINRIAVGNEILATSDKTLIAHTLPAMEALYKALQLANLTHIQVSTPHSLGILTSSEPPSSAAFRRGYDKTIFTPILNFLRQTNSPFMVNPYPFFGITSTRPDTLNYALFKPFHGVFDAATGVNYTNMFDAQMDAVFSAMKKLGYGDVELVVAETGWPSAGDPNQPGVGVDNAASYNGNLIKHVSSGKGTPLMPNRTFETFIFSLFNENLKATVSERNYGLFKPDLTPVYDVGVLTQRHQQAAGPTSGPTAAPAEAPSSGSGESPSSSKWCTAKQGASEAALQANIDFACSTKGVDCGPIKQGGPCFKPNTVRAHASFAMNAYYQASGRHDTDCDFGHTGLVTSINPSYETCTYVSSAEGPKQKVKNPDTVGSPTPTGSPVGSPKPAKSNDAGSLKAFLVHLQLICFCFFYL